MNKQTSRNPYAEDWKREIDTKDYEDLVRIVAYEENYNPEFVRMATATLKASELYDEKDVQLQIEKMRKEPLPKQKDPANTILKVANIGCLTLKVIITLLVVFVVIVAGLNSSAMNNGMKGAMATIMFGICIGLYKIGIHLWKNKDKR